MFVQDAIHIHAALTHFPLALLLCSVLFDLLGSFLKRDSLKAAGLWTLVTGVLGGCAAVIAGLLAAKSAQVGITAQGTLETHETLAFIVLAMFAALALWRILRKGVWSEKEQPVALTAGVIAAALLIVTGAFGGKLVFDNGVGVPTTVLQHAIQDRSAPAPAPEPGLPVAGPQAPAAQPNPVDSSAPAAPPPDSARPD